MNMFREIREKVGMFLILIFLPIVGINFAKRPIFSYLEFPPLTRYVRHADFSWPIFIGLAFCLVVVMAPFALKILFSRGAESVPLPGAKKKFPWWGWCGIGLTAVAWTLAWTRFSWFESLQIFTFTPIWLGYIIVINALTYKRTGKCMLINRTGYFIGLFVISAIFWWYFEYLNRFVQNWYYEGIGNLSKREYFLFATLPFSTVLPAVLGTYDLLKSVPRLSAGLDSFVRVPVKHAKPLGWIMFLISASSLALIGLWPDYLFPMLWLSPLFIITSLQTIRGQNTIFSSIGYGYWRRIFLLALAALVCGFFWELWNYKSIAKWIYSVPFVGEFKIFEMPILGYIGYLPFGLECAVIADLFTAKQKAEPIKIDEVCA